MLELGCRGANEYRHVDLKRAGCSQVNKPPGLGRCSRVGMQRESLPYVDTADLQVLSPHISDRSMYEKALLFRR